MARFFTRWLKGEERVIVEENWPLEKDADLQCTRSGQVLEDLHGRSVFDLNRALADDFAKKRAGKKFDAAELRKEVASVLGLPNEEPRLTREADPKSFKWNGYATTKELFESEPGLPLPAVSQAPERGMFLPRWHVIFVSDRGKEPALALGGQVEKLLKDGKDVRAVDLRGWGETAPGIVAPDKVPTFGVEYKESFLSFHLNRPLPSQRVWDLLAMVGKDRGIVDKELFGVGAAAPVVLHTAILREHVKSVVIEGGLVSWDNVLRTPIHHNQLSNVVPGVLKHYDLPDLAAAIAPRPLTIRNPVDAAGKPLTKEAAEAAYKGVRAAYKAANASEKFVLEVK
jgi:hypothetical protein